MTGALPQMGMTGTTGTWQAGPPQARQWTPPPPPQAAPPPAAPQFAPQQQWTPPPPQQQQAYPSAPQQAYPSAPQQAYPPAQQQAAAPQQPPPMSFPAPPQQYMPQPGQKEARGGLPGWAIALVVGGVLVLGGYLIVNVLIPSMRGDGASPEVASAKSEPPTPGSPAETLKYLEVTGLRLSESKQKAQITMAIINHAAADLTDIEATVLIHTTKDKPGDTPLAQLELKLPTIPANSVRDINMPFPTKLRAYELPDWQFLRAEVVPHK